MQLTTTELDGEITLVELDGALDIAGAEEIGLRMSVLAGSRRFIVVNMRKVPFLASMGIRVLLTTAKSTARRGGRLLLLNPTPTVRGVLTTTGVEELIPMVDTLEEGIALCSPR